MGESAKIVCWACLPDVLVGATHQTRIFKGLASVRVDHGVGVVCAAVLGSNEVLSGLGISGAGSRRKRGGWAMALVLAAI